MRRTEKIILLLSMVVFATACTKSHVRQWVGSAVADGADTQVKYSEFECRTLRQQCVQGNFQEWQTSNKDLGCSCKKL